MKISIDLTGTQEEQFVDAARRLNVQPEELAVAAIRDLITQPAPDFQRAAEQVLRKNHELYQRLR